MVVEEGTNRRPKGYVSWRPQAKTRVILDQVKDILVQYQDHLPLTARQIFYRLVGAYGYPKEELAYNRLCEYLVRARRSGLIPFDNIRDDGTIQIDAGGFYGPESFWSWVSESADRYIHSRDDDQGQSIEVWCEAGGMTPQLSRVARQYGVDVYSTGGFSSVTVTHQIAQRVVHDPRPTVFLHIGDFDPSGQSIYEAMSEDVWTFVNQMKRAAEKNNYEGHWTHVEPTCDFMYSRVALTQEQVEEYDLPTAPPKPKDTRTRNWIGETCQAEAMAPSDLADILKNAILDELDQEAHRRIVDEVEPVERAQVKQEVRVYQEILGHATQTSEDLPEG